MQQRVWRGLIAALAVGLAIKVLGLIGCILVGALMVFLWRWPKHQTIAASILAGVLFVVAVLLHGYRPASPVATPTASAIEQIIEAKPPADSPTNWNRVASAFEAAHPDLKYGQNTEIMQSKINALAGGRLNNEGVLSVAYATAKLDPAWTTFATSQPDATVEHAHWDADAHAFIAAHPDLNFGSNLQVMDGYTKIMVNSARNQSNVFILNSAYAAAQRDPHWSFIEVATSPSATNP